MIPSRIIIHHSATEDSGTVSWVAIRHYHTVVLHWSDIGYHAGCELVKNVDNAYYEVLMGRMWDIVGAHAEGQNSDSLGFCFVGDFDKIKPPAKQLIAGAKALKLWMKLFNIGMNNIYRHSDFSPKTCPGSRFDLEILKALLE